MAQKKVLKEGQNLENYKSLAAKGYLSQVEYLKYEDLISMGSSIGRLRRCVKYMLNESTRRELKKALILPN